MPSKPLAYRVAFSTPWFEIEESLHSPAGELPYYRMTGPDGVICLPFTPDGDIIMVRQYRPNLGCDTIEIPAGAIERDETILEAAAREIEEESGNIAADLMVLGSGRLQMNRTTHIEHFVLAFDAKPSARAGAEAEPLFVSRSQLVAMIRAEAIEQIAALSFLGLASVKLGVDLLRDPVSVIRERAMDETVRRQPDGS